MVLDPADGSVLVAGQTSGTWGNENQTNGVTGTHDFAAFKLDSEGLLLWKWQVRFVSLK